MDHPTSLKPDPSDYVALVASAAVALVMGVLIFAPVAMAEPVSPVTADVTLIARGIHGASCDARSIAAGISARATAEKVVEKLSVSCSDDTSVGAEVLRERLGGSHACLVVLGELRQMAPGVRLVRDPTAPDPYHCLLSGVTPNQFVSRATWRP